jgi:hypothetical protein
MTNITNITNLTNMTYNRRREFRVRKIPEELYKQFKIVSVLKGLTVNELFLEAMTEIVKKENNKT